MDGWYRLEPVVRSAGTAELAAGRPVPAQGDPRREKDQDALPAGTYSYLGASAVAGPDGCGSHRLGSKVRGCDRGCSRYRKLEGSGRRRIGSPVIGEYWNRDRIGRRLLEWRLLK